MSKAIEPPPKIPYALIGRVYPFSAAVGRRVQGTIGFYGILAGWFFA
jgi:hypothetical protein